MGDRRQSFKVPAPTSFNPPRSTNTVYDSSDVVRNWKNTFSVGVVEGGAASVLVNL